MPQHDPWRGRWSVAALPSRPEVNALNSPTPHACAARVVDADRVATVVSRMPSEPDLVDTADVFGLLADPGRLRLLLAMTAGELCVCDLAVVSGLSESAASRALRLLRAHRVVSVRRTGRMAYYRLDDAHVRMLLDLAVAHTEHTEAVHPERDTPQ